MAQLQKVQKFSSGPDFLGIAPSRNYSARMNSHLNSLLAQLRDQARANSELAALDLPRLADPAVRLVAQKVRQAQLGLGESRIGGNPDVPPGFEWPRWLPTKPRNDKLARPWRPNGPAPLGFLAQIDLSAIPSIGDLLPSSGWFYFFYDRYCEPWGFDPADRGCCRVLYANCAKSALERVAPPFDADCEHIAEACRLEARSE